MHHRRGSGRGCEPHDLDVLVTGTRRSFETLLIENRDGATAVAIIGTDHMSWMAWVTDSIVYLSLEALCALPRKWGAVDLHYRVLPVW